MPFYTIRVNLHIFGRNGHSQPSYNPILIEYQSMILRNQHTSQPRTPLLSILCLSVLVGAVTGISLPNCQTNSFYKILPLTPNEAYYLDMGSLFTGYNLRFNYSSDADLQKYIKLTNKIGLQKEEYPDVALQGLKSIHVARIGNSWGQQFIALT